MDKSLFLTQLSVGKAQLEANTADFIKRVKDTEAMFKKKNRRHVDRYASGKQLEHYYQGVTADNDGNTVVIFKIPSSKNKNANPADYKFYYCFIDIIPKDTTLFNLAKAKAKLSERMQILKDADIKFFCTCPDFNWSGMKYNLKHVYDSYLSGYESIEGVPSGGEDIPPKVRDPHHQHRVCKHLLAAFNAVLTNWMTIIKAAKNYTVPSENKPVEPTVETPVEPTVETPLTYSHD